MRQPRVALYVKLPATMVAKIDQLAEERDWTKTRVVEELLAVLLDKVALSESFQVETAEKKPSPPAPGEHRMMPKKQPRQVPTSACAAQTTRTVEYDGGSPELPPRRRIKLSDFH